MNVPVWDHGGRLALPPLSHDESADVCVVGLGGSGLAAVHELLDAGVRVIGGSDFRIETLSPLKGLQLLVTGDHLDGRRAGARRLPLERAFPLVTDAAAGTTVLSDDPFAVPEDELSQLEVVETRPAA